MIPGFWPFRPHGTSTRVRRTHQALIRSSSTVPPRFFCGPVLRTDVTETSHHHRKTGSRQGCPGTWRGSRDHGWSSRARHLAHLVHLVHREADARHHGRGPVLRTPRASAGTSQPDVATGFKPLPGGHCLAVPGCACVEHDGQRGNPWRHTGRLFRDEPSSANLPFMIAALRQALRRNPAQRLAAHAISPVRPGIPRTAFASV